MQVQRQTPSLFLVTHTGRHTCKTSSSTTDDDDTVKPSASHITEPFLLRFDSGDHYKMEENKSYVRKDTVQTSSGKLESADPTSCVDSLSSVALDMDFSIFDFDEIEYQFLQVLGEAPALSDRSIGSAINLGCQQEEKIETLFNIWCWIEHNDLLNCLLF